MSSPTLDVGLDKVTALAESIITLTCHDKLNATGRVYIADAGNEPIQQVSAAGIIFISARCIVAEFSD
jgi:hypothetical protein